MPPDWQLLSGRQGQRSPPAHTRAQGRGHLEHPPRCPPALVHRFASLPVPSVPPAPGLGLGAQRTPTSCSLHPQRHPLLDCTHPNLSLSCRRNTGCATGPTGSVCPRQPRSARRKLSRWAWARGGAAGLICWMKGRPGQCGQPPPPACRGEGGGRHPSPPTPRFLPSPGTRPRPPARCPWVGAPGKGQSGAFSADPHGALGPGAEGDLPPGEEACHEAAAQRPDGPQCGHHGRQPQGECRPRLGPSCFGGPPPGTAQAHQPLGRRLGVGAAAGCSHVLGQP